LRFHLNIFSVKSSSQEDGLLFARRNPLLIIVFFGLFSFTFLAILNASVCLDFVNIDVVKGLVGILVLETVPRLFVGVLINTLALMVVHTDGQNNHHVPSIFEIRESQAHLTVVVDLQVIVSEVVHVH